MEDAVNAEDEGSRSLVTFAVGDQYYAVPTDPVREMTTMRETHPIAGAPAWVPGMMQLRDSLVPILDLRVRLGLPSFAEETGALAKELAERKADHLNWLKALESSCEAGSVFELERDPTQCAFGRWYYAFKTSDDVLAHELKRFEEPHRRIHALADQCMEMVRCGNREGALQEIEASRHADLAVLVRLFEAITRSLRERSRQMVIILQGENESLGLAVDQIESVMNIASDQLEPRPLQHLGESASQEAALVETVARADGDRPLIQLLSTARLLDACSELDCSATAPAPAQDTQPQPQPQPQQEP